MYRITCVPCASGIGGYQATTNSSVLHCQTVEDIAKILHDLAHQHRLMPGTMRYSPSDRLMIDENSSPLLSFSAPPTDLSTCSPEFSTLYFIYISAADPQSTYTSRFLPMTEFPANMYSPAPENPVLATNTTSEIPNKMQAQAFINLRLTSISAGHHGIFAEPIVLQLVEINRQTPLQPRLLELYLCGPEKNIKPLFVETERYSAVQTYLQILLVQATQPRPAAGGTFAGLRAYMPSNPIAGLASCIFPKNEA